MVSFRQTMQAVCSLRNGTVAGVIAWKLTALALLPAAFCCQAVLDADSGTRACCDGTDHGDFCPLRQANPSPAPDNPRLQTCESFDDALIGLLSLTGFTPEASEPQAALDESGGFVHGTYSVNSLYRTPASPPPRT